LLAALLLLVGVVGPAHGYGGPIDRSDPTIACEGFLIQACDPVTGKPTRPTGASDAGVTLEPQALTPTPGFTDETVFGGLQSPTVVRFSPDGRVFVAEKAGLIKVFSSLTDTTPTVFANLNAEVHNFWDRGLLGLALHPNFPATPWVYALYTYDHVLGSSSTGPRWGTAGVLADPCPTPPGPNTDGCVVSARLVRLQASASNADVSDGTVTTLVEDWCQQYPSHSIGTLAFGPDGMLYASGGDGASFTFTDWGQGASNGTANGRNVCADPGSAQFVAPPASASEAGALRSQDVRTMPTGTAAAYRPTVLGDTPLRYWRLGEASGTAVIDETGSGVNGTYGNTPTLGVPGAIPNDANTAVTFSSASSESVELNSAVGYPTGNAARTLEAWVRTSSVAEQGIFAYGNYSGTEARTFFSMMIAPDGRLMVSTDADFPQFGPAGALTNGAWHHVVVTYDGSVIRAFLDGVAMSGSPFTPGAPLATTTTNHWLANTGTRTLNGTLDEVALYSRALSAAEVLEHFQAATSTTGTTDPVGLDGTVIRIDPTTGAGAPGNPMASSGDASARRVVAYGFRNPFRFTFRPGTNELWVADVGWNTWEEIQRIASPTSAVTNAGWPCSEGTSAQGSYQAAGIALCQNLYGSGVHAAPYYTYDHNVAVVAGETCVRTSGSAIAGLVVYPTSGAPYPAKYQGALFFADHNRKCIWAMLRGGNGLPDPATIETFVQDAGNPVHLELGPDGFIYYVDFEGNAIHRIRSLGTNTPPTAVATAIPTSGDAPLLVQLDASGSSDPDAGQTLTYSWDVDGNGTFGEATGVSPSWTYTSPGSFSARVRVTDNLGASTTSNAVTITVGTPGTPPVAVIDTPTSDVTWIVGSVITFSGHGDDQEDGAIPAANMTWDIVQQHCPSACHPHGVTSVVGAASGSFTAPDHDYPSYIDITLTVTDSDGTSASTTVRLSPRTVDLTFQTTPVNLQLAHNGSVQTAPFTIRAIIGSSNSVSAPTPQDVGAVRYAFASWSDGGAASHSLTAPATDATYIAAYTGVSANVGIQKAGVANSATSRVTYTLTVTNAGPAAATAVTVRDTLPSKLVYISSTASQGGCSVASGTVTCTLGTIASGGSATVTIVATANKFKGSVTNTATVTTTAPDPVTSNNSSSVTVRLN
jgi:uncharacterized repeat protein (TIGR01451 family)